MIGNQPAVGDKVHHEGRVHPTKDGWLQANGVIVNLIEEDDEVNEIVVEFGEDDFEVYDVGQLEWEPLLGGYWRVA